MLDFKFCVEICADRFLANLRLRQYALVVPSLVGLIANVEAQKEFQRAIGLVSILVYRQASQLRFRNVSVNTPHRPEAGNDASRWMSGPQAHQLTTAHPQLKLTLCSPERS